MIKGKGKTFEFFVRNVLINIGFDEVASDGIYIYTGTAGQMINGLGESHNADVLLEPPVQIPFSAMTRLLIECKDFKNGDKVGLDIIRSALGLRTDINSFEVLDYQELLRRKPQNRRKSVHYMEYTYSVAIASTSGFSDQAQKMAATYRIPLIDFSKYPFWSKWIQKLQEYEVRSEAYDEERLCEYIKGICRGMAVAVTSTGQLLFLHNPEGTLSFTDETYSFRWDIKGGPWTLICADVEYRFYLPQLMTLNWLTEESGEEKALEANINTMSRMVVYYRENGQARIKVLSNSRKIMKEFYEEFEAKERVQILKIDGDSITEYKTPK